MMSDEPSLRDSAMILYIKPWCPWCIDAVRWLQRRNYSFEKADVLTDANAYARMKSLSGQSLTPTLEMPDGGVLADFDTGQLEKFLESRKVSP